MIIPDWDGTDTKESGDLLRQLLPIAVSLWAKKIQKDIPDNWEFYQKILQDYNEKCLDEPEFTTALLFKTKGKTAESFNRFAQAIAILSFAPGGIQILGLHFEYKK